MSQSNVRYITTIGFAHAVTQIIARKYEKKEGRLTFKNMLMELYEICDNILINNKEKITDKESVRIKKAIKIMEDNGLENASSYKTYISFLIGAVNERMTEMPENKRQSPKYVNLEVISERLVSMYQYYDLRVKNEDYDADALKLLNNFNELF